MSAVGQPLYRPFMILALVTLAVIAAAVWFLWQRQTQPLSLIDTFRELIRADRVVVHRQPGGGRVVSLLEPGDPERECGETPRASFA